MESFGDLMRAEPRRHGYSLRSACKAMFRDPAYPSRVMNGKSAPSPGLAADLDTLLGTSEFTALFEVYRAAAVASSSRVDPAVVTALRSTLDASRLLDDALGSAAVAPSAQSHLRQVAALARHARGPHRDDLISVAAGWGVFTGRVATATGQWSTARAALALAMEWSAEVADPTLSSVAWSFRAYLDSTRGNHAVALGLAIAAAGTAGAHPAQQVYTQLQRAAC